MFEVKRTGTANNGSLPSVASIKLNSNMSDAEIAGKYDYILNDLKKSQNYSQGSLQDAVPKDSDYYQRYAKFANNHTGLGWTVGVVRGYQDSFDGVRQLEYRTKYGVAKSAYELSQDTKIFFDKAGDFVGHANGWLAKKLVTAAVEYSLECEKEYSKEEIQKISQDVGQSAHHQVKEATRTMVSKGGELFGEGIGRVYSAFGNAVVDAASSGGQGALVGTTLGLKGAAVGAVGSIAVNEVKSIFTNESTGIIKNVARSLFNSTESEVQTRRADVQVQELKNKISESVYHQHYREGKYVNKDGSTNFDGGRLLGVAIGPGLIVKGGVLLAPKNAGTTLSTARYLGATGLTAFTTGVGLSLSVQRVLDSSTDVGAENDYWSTKVKYALASGAMTVVGHSAVSGLNNVAGAYLLSKGIGSYSATSQKFGDLFGMAVTPPFISGVTQITKNSIDKMGGLFVKPGNVTTKSTEEGIKAFVKNEKDIPQFLDVLKGQLNGTIKTDFVEDVVSKYAKSIVERPGWTPIMKNFTSSTNLATPAKVYARIEAKQAVDQMSHKSLGEQFVSAQPYPQKAFVRHPDLIESPLLGWNNWGAERNREARQHQVKPGESLSSIAKMHTPKGTSITPMMEAIDKANADAFKGERKVVQPNVMLKIPTLAEAQASKPTQQNAPAAHHEPQRQHEQKPVSDKSVVDKYFINSAIKLQHQVKPGESLSSIAKMHTPKGSPLEPTIQAIEKANPDAFKGERKVVQPYTMLTIPKENKQQATDQAKGQTEDQCFWAQVASGVSLGVQKLQNSMTNLDLATREWQNVQKNPDFQAGQTHKPEAVKIH